MRGAYYGIKLCKYQKLGALAPRIKNRIKARDAVCLYDVVSKGVPYILR
jgi:hypothetical protein